MDDLKTLLAAKAAPTGNRIYIGFRNRTLTFREIDLFSNRFAHAFHDLGSRKGEHMAVVLPNCPEWIAYEKSLFLCFAI